MVPRKQRRIKTEPFETEKDESIADNDAGSVKGSDLNSDRKREEGAATADLLDDYLAEMPKYITLNQVSIKIAGGTDKLLVIRDVTSIVMNENIMETKRQMARMTDEMVRSIEERATWAEGKLSKMDQFITAKEGLDLNDETTVELKKM